MKFPNFWVLHLDGGDIVIGASESRVGREECQKRSPSILAIKGLGVAFQHFKKQCLREEIIEI